MTEPSPPAALPAAPPGAVAPTAPASSTPPAEVEVLPQPGSAPPRQTPEVFAAVAAVPRTAPDPESPPAGEKSVGRREDVAAPAPTTAGGEESPLSTTTGQFVLVLVVVGLVGGATAAWTLRTSRR